MKIYEVESKYYDNGTVSVIIKEFESEKVPCNTYLSTNKYDIYRDFFTDKAEVQKNLSEIRRC